MTSAARGAIVLVLLAGTGAAGCGRREQPAWFDAQPPPAVVVAAGGSALPASALKVRWGMLSVPRTVGANSVLPVVVSLANAGNVPWPDVAAASPLKNGSYAVRLSHEWIPAADPHDDRRAARRHDLPRSVMPGESIDVPLTLHAPAEAGEYTLVIELVQELVQWFADRGADRIILPVRVVSDGAAPADRPSSR